MCGIVAVVGERSRHEPCAAAEVVAALDAAMALVMRDDALGALDEAARALEGVDAELRGPRGVVTFLREPSLAGAVASRTAVVEAKVNELERRLDSGELHVEETALERTNSGLVRLKDVLWALRRDRLRCAGAVADLSGNGPSRSAVEAYWAIDVALSALGRLEVRGRDSAGLHVLVKDHGLDVGDPELRRRIDERSDPLFRNRAVRISHGHLAFVYKVAAEIGELGDNTRALRDAVRADELLREAVSGDDARVTVVGHTRWASVGIISEPNAHPLNQEQVNDAADPYVAAVLNGDVDNYSDLRAAEELSLPAEVTTDAKVIPVLTAKRRREGMSLDEAFRRTVAAFDGSVAILASAAEDADRLHLALRGSGQALYVGLADDAFVVASEPYGLVEETDRYLRMDGEAPASSGSRGQVVVLDRARAGSTAGIRRTAYDGTELPVDERDVQRAEVTTRDIDRADHPHFLLKEISESPQSVRKTLRGKIAKRGSRLSVSLPAETLPEALRRRLQAGDVARVVVIGQGTAAVAGLAVAAAMRRWLASRGIDVEALPATELSGFGMDDDMSRTIVVAISQSGTTTDTNRTVDLVRAHGAAVLGIVNRRNSDLVEKADGVLYTSDGRDVEMAVPSTKAFYAQITAGLLLAIGLAEAAGGARPRDVHELLSALRELPEAMERVLDRREVIAEAAQSFAPSRRYWAVVGNGLNRVAAHELRIKLSELCYKSISCDSTEDKKHIDLSSEPLILVCAAGLNGATADDVAKEIAIYRAHKAAPIVIATEGSSTYDAALRVVEVPRVHPELAFVLSTMAGHLFGYEAALAIDAQARRLREARGVVERLVSSAPLGEEVLERLAPMLAPLAREFFDNLRAGAYNGHLEASTAVRLSSLLRYGTLSAPLALYEVEHGKIASPAAVVEDLLDALTGAIDELTRPIDAIKHQAKTVTVGISRAEDTYLEAPLVKEALAAGAERDRLSYRALKTLAALGPAVRGVTGSTRYVVEGNAVTAEARIHVVGRTGVAVGIPSRTDRDPTLRGTKHRVATEREVTVARGRHDQRTVVIVPETKDNQVTALTLLHVDFDDRLESSGARAVLEAYRDRYSALVDAVTETEPEFDDAALGRIPIVDLLVEPVYVLADRWFRTPSR